MLVQLGIVGYYKVQTVQLGFAQDPLTREYWFWMINSLHQQPWTLWAVSTKGWTYLAAPYGLLWYLFYYPISASPVTISWGIFAIDQLVSILLLLFSRRSLFIIYQTSSLLMLSTYQNMVILWFLVGSVALSRLLVKSIGLLLALATKFPVGAPLYVWNYILFSATSIHDRQNWLYYAILGFWGIWSLVTIINGRREQPMLQSVSSSSGPLSSGEQTVNG